MKNDIDHCQYCYAHYDKCDCCNKCGSLKGKCECTEHSPTILSPADVYRYLYYASRSFRDFFGMNSISEIDAMVVSFYQKEFWPKRLKEKL